MLNLNNLTPQQLQQLQQMQMQQQPMLLRVANATDDPYGANLVNAKVAAATQSGAAANDTVAQAVQLALAASRHAAAESEAAAMLLAQAG
jgi:hypothetical protein